MDRFVKIFSGYPSEVEDEINEMIRKRNLVIVSASTCVSLHTFYVTVIFEKGKNND